MNCICQNGPQRPGMQEVLNSLESHTVCTGTQCFEGEEDAFGLTAAPNGQPANNANFFMFMMCAASQAPPPGIQGGSAKGAEPGDRADQPRDPRSASAPPPPPHPLSLAASRATAWASVQRPRGQKLVRKMWREPRASAAAAPSAVWRACKFRCSGKGPGGCGRHQHVAATTTDAATPQASPTDFGPLSTSATGL